MSQSDPLADMLTRLRNATNVGKAEVTLPYSKMKGEIARVLKKEGFIKEYKVESVNSKPVLAIELKYSGNARALQSLRRVSKPGLRKYVGADEIPKVLGGLGICILSTPQGIMTGRDARKAKVGGEVLAYVY